MIVDIIVIVTITPECSENCNLNEKASREGQKNVSCLVASYNFFYLLFVVNPMMMTMKI